MYAPIDLEIIYQGDVFSKHPFAIIPEEETQVLRKESDKFEVSPISKLPSVFPGGGKK